MDKSDITQNWQERLVQAVELSEDLTCVCMDCDFSSVTTVANRLEQILGETRLEGPLHNLKIAAKEQNRISLHHALNDFNAIFLAMRINAFLRNPENKL